jgi:hypothetical protein
MGSGAWIWGRRNRQLGLSKLIGVGEVLKMMALDLSC